MSALLVMNWIGYESVIELFLLPPEVVSEYREVLEQCHNLVINKDTLTPELEILNAAVTATDYRAETEKSLRANGGVKLIEHLCRFAPYLQDSSQPLETEISVVYVVGCA